MTYHPRNAIEAVSRVLLLAVLVLLCAVAVTHGGEYRQHQPEEATVLMGGCSGVCVTPDGLILTAAHCDLGDAAIVEFRGRGQVRATLAHHPDQDECVVAYRCDPGEYPWVPVASEMPQPGDSVFSMGYPAEGQTRQFRRGEGKIIGGSVGRAMWGGKR